MTKKKMKKVLRKIDEAMEAQNELVRVLVERFASGAAEVERQLAFTRKLEAFFGPMIAGKNPPLDGTQVASKAYVDDALARLARALREEEGRRGETPGSIS